MIGGIVLVLVVVLVLDWPSFFQRSRMMSGFSNEKDDREHERRLF